MKFDMKKPCKNCPFIKGNCFEQSLSRERVSMIIEDISTDKTFPCHKHESPEQNCVGSALFVKKLEISNSMLQIAQRLRLYDESSLGLRKGTELYDNQQEMLNSYKE
jgi:hypothetical protein